MIILGLHGGVTIGQHDPSAALIIDGKIVAACEEERYLRIKSSYGYLPLYSINACLSIAGIKAEDIDLIVTPGITYGDFSERIRLHFYNHFGTCPKIESVHHQEAHLACAFYGSGLDSAMCLSLDATGDGASGMIGFATKDSGIKIARTLKTEESIGYFYSIITDYLGFQDGDEYKVMGLAPYGSPTFDLQSIIKPVPGGWSFDWGCVREKPPLRSPFEAKYSDKLQSILKIPNRPQCRPLDQEHRNLARSAQEAFESCWMRIGLRMRNAPTFAMRVAWQ